MSAASSPTPEFSPYPDVMPLPDPRQLLRMTDDTGLFQHAVHGLPDPNHGYCVDDNARAVLAAIQFNRLHPDAEPLPLDRYLAFVVYAFHPSTGRFRNFMGYDRRWLEDVGSPDSQGRAAWSLGYASRHAPRSDQRRVAHDLLEQALAGLTELGGLPHLRARAFTLFAVDEWLETPEQPGPPEAAAELFVRFAEDLQRAFVRNAGKDWPWWEDTVTYDNARLPEAMLRAGRRLRDESVTEIGLTSLRWLIDQQTAPEGHLSIIGNAGWLTRDGQHARFDQQPLEALAIADACLLAHHITADDAWLDDRRRALAWFTGENDLGQSLIHPDTGGCRDGLEAHGINQNQGAESILAYLLATLG